MADIHRRDVKAGTLVTYLIVASLVFFGNMALGAGTLKVTTPNGGEDWITGSKYLVKWNKGDAGSKVKIELLKGRKVYKTIKKRTKNDGRYRWTIPSAVKTSSRYKIQITSITDDAISDSSDKKFSITKKSNAVLRLTSPNGGESWERGSTYAIEWTKRTGTNKVNLELWKGSGTSGSLTLEIASETINDGTYDWTIPSTVATGSNYEIKIADHSDSDIVDRSNSNFSITKQTSFLIRSSAFNDTALIPKKYTCDGSDASPPLRFSGVPDGTKEMVLFLDDLDGSPSSTNTTSDWNHWVVMDIPIRSSFKAYRIPSGAVEATNDASDREYDPICPPMGGSTRDVHNYQFTIYAIDKNLNESPSATRASIKSAMTGSILAETTFQGYYPAK